MTALRKCILVLLDGLADRAQASLGGLTPLQAAATPNLDRLAGEGACGYFHALAPGQALSSEAAHFFMMGYTPEEFPGRGYLEAVGAELDFGQNDILLLAHLARCRPQDGRLVLREKKPSLAENEVEELFRAVYSYEGPEGTARLERTKGSSGVLILSGGALAASITDSDPMYPGLPLMEPLPWEGSESDPAALCSCALLMAYLRWAYARLAAHPLNAEATAPVNAVISQRAGRTPRLSTLEQRWGLRALSISSAPIYRGVFRALGAQAMVTPEASDPGRDLAVKLALAGERLEEFDLIHVHSKAPDEAGHKKDPALKRQVIAALDAGLGQGLEALAGRDILLVVTGDHATACSGNMVHSGEPSPLLLWGPGVWRDQATAFSETRCAQGALGLLKGPELIHTILNGLDRGKLWGLRDNPRDLPYYPATRRALSLET